MLTYFQSHLLSRRGMAQRIGNLLGQLEFSEDQLAQTQKGLTAAGVNMPNFKSVGNELAKEINEEPEVEIETEDERKSAMTLKPVAVLNLSHRSRQAFAGKRGVNYCTTGSVPWLHG